MHGGGVRVCRHGKIVVALFKYISFLHVGVVSFEIIFLYLYGKGLMTAVRLKGIRLCIAHKLSLIHI